MDAARRRSTVEPRETVWYENDARSRANGLTGHLTNECGALTQMAKPRLDDPLTTDQLRTLLHYNAKTGAFTWRRRDRLGHYARTWNTRYAGKVAGTPTVPHGYIQIMVNEELYLAHRLAHLWMTGAWPASEIDHRDGNRANNRWNNLRVATSSQNKMNGGRRSDNTSGYRGVRFDKRRGIWVAEIYANGIKHHIGYFQTAEAAAAAYAEAAARIHGPFANRRYALRLRSA
jgi:hypothetical protein